jgi:hypothetical protein
MYIFKLIMFGFLSLTLDLFEIDFRFTKILKFWKAKYNLY